MGFLIARLLEPSTWAGLTGLAVSLGTSPDVMHEIAQAGAALASLAAVALPERARRGVPQRAQMSQDEASRQP